MEKDDNKNEEVMKKDQVVIILEDIRDKFGVLADGQKDLREKFDLMAEDMDCVKSDIVDIKIELKLINGKLENKAEKKAVENHEVRIVKLEKLSLAK